MLATLITDSGRANKQAKSMCPVIWQEFISAKDFLTPIIEGKVTEAGVPATLIRGMKSPTLYFKAMEDGEWEYTHFTVYHPFDWSDSSISFIRAWDSHRHDTEGILIRRSKKKRGVLRRYQIDACSVFHHTFEFLYDTTLEFRIQAKGHGIQPLDKNGIDNKNYIRYSKFDLIDWGNWSGEKQAAIKAEFNRTGVNFPDQMKDKHLSMLFRDPRRHGGLTHEPGDIWNRPDKVFECAEKVGRI